MHSSACTRDCCSERKPQKEEACVERETARRRRLAKRSVPATSPLGGTEFGSARHCTCLRDKNEKPGGQSRRTSISCEPRGNESWREPAATFKVNLVRAWLSGARYRDARCAPRCSGAPHWLQVFNLVRLLKKQQLCRARPRKAGRARRDPHPLYVATQRPACEDRGEMSLGLATVGVASWTLENNLGWGSEFIDRRQKFSSPRRVDPSSL
ncbi:hypothetical protein EDB86DRAFT_2824873 [Lactarius hatsudake]|nr:hypothetical protein EDB86DRAFT_2824873 [Lactarius hatsudake]